MNVAQNNTNGYDLGISHEQLEENRDKIKGFLSYKITLIEGLTEEIEGILKVYNQIMEATTKERLVQIVENNSADDYSETEDTDKKEEIKQEVEEEKKEVEEEVVEEKKEVKSPLISIANTKNTGEKPDEEIKEEETTTPLDTKQEKTEEIEEKTEEEPKKASTISLNSLIGKKD